MKKDGISQIFPLPGVLAVGIGALWLVLTLRMRYHVITFILGVILSVNLIVAMVKLFTEKKSLSEIGRMILMAIFCAAVFSFEGAVVAEAVRPYTTRPWTVSFAVGVCGVLIAVLTCVTLGVMLRRGAIIHLETGKAVSCAQKSITELVYMGLFGSWIVADHTFSPIPWHYVIVDFAFGAVVLFLLFSAYGNMRKAYTTEAVVRYSRDKDVTVLVRSSVNGKVLIDPGCTSQPILEMIHNGVLRLAYPDVTLTPSGSKWYTVPQELLDEYRADKYRQQ